jgi:hypothetical protein
MLGRVHYDFMLFSTICLHAFALSIFSDKNLISYIMNLFYSCMKLEWAMEECTVCFTDMRQVDEHGARLTFANLEG